MKLAFCLFNYFPYGGLQRDFLRIAHACQARGHAIHVYTMRWEGDVPPWITLHLLTNQKRQNHTQARAFVMQVQAALQKASYDVVIGFNKMPELDLYYAADVCYQARIMTNRSFLYRYLPRYRQWQTLEKAVFAPCQPTDILCISPLQQAVYTAYYQTEAHRFHLLPPGITKDRMATDQAADRRAALRQAYHIPDDHFLLLMIGSGFKTKGLDRALHALAALSPDLKKRCHFFVIGQDHSKPFMKLAAQLHIQHHVTFLGGRDDVPQFLLAGDLLLHPAYHENTGTVLLEAIVAGLPVLTLDVCGYAHYVQDADAGVVLSSPFQQTALNAALETMLLSPQRAQWQRHGLTFAQQADLYSLPERAADLIEQRGKHRDADSVRAEEAAKQPSRSMNRKISPFETRAAHAPQGERVLGAISIFMHDHLKPHFTAPLPLFDQVMALRGECFRQQKGRLTQRIQLGETTYFIKQHHGVGWKEIFKNLLQGRLPVISAKNEWQAIQTLQSLGVAVPAVLAFGERRINPARRQSFVLMEALSPTISLETLCQDWRHHPPSFVFKQRLIEEVARIARTLHDHGMNHRDFYLCHFLLKVTPDGVPEPNLVLYLIDLHRAQRRRLTPLRWIIKDLAGLFFSSKDSGLTVRDLYRFMKWYRQNTLHDIMRTEQHFWQKVKKRGEQLYRDHGGS